MTHLAIAPSATVHLIAKLACESIGKLGEFATPITLERGLEILDADTLSARGAVDRLVKVDLTDDQFGALVSFTFNVGKGNFQSSTLLTLVNAGNLAAASKQFGRWIKSNGVVLGGLVDRRACEAALFNGAVSYRSDETFHREDCAGLGIAPEGDLIDVAVGER